MTCFVRRESAKLTVSMLIGQETFGMEEHKNEMVS